MKTVIAVDYTGLIAELDAREKEIQQARDRLDQTIEQYSGMLESCDRAIDSIQCARDALSEYV